MPVTWYFGGLDSSQVPRHIVVVTGTRPNGAVGESLGYRAVSRSVVGPLLVSQSPGCETVFLKWLPFLKFSPLGLNLGLIISYLDPIALTKALLFMDGNPGNYVGWNLCTFIKAYGELKELLKGNMNPIFRDWGSLSHIICFLDKGIKPCTRQIITNINLYLTQISIHFTWKLTFFQLNLSGKFPDLPNFEIHYLWQHCFKDSLIGIS